VRLNKNALFKLPNKHTLMKFRACNTPQLYECFPMFDILGAMPEPEEFNQTFEPAH